jgi:hypothetical protein
MDHFQILFDDLWIQPWFDFCQNGQDCCHTFCEKWVPHILRNILLWIISKFCMMFYGCKIQPKFDFGLCCLSVKAQQNDQKIFMPDKS